MSIKKQHITVAQLEDCEDIVDAQIRLALESENLQLERKVVTQGVSHILENSTQGFYLVCKEENEFLGCGLVLFEWSDWRNGLVLWLHSVYVVPEARKSGVFRMLWNHLVQKIQIDEKMKGIRLYVDSQNFMAKNVYHRMGMETGHYEIFEYMKASE